MRKIFFSWAIAVAMIGSVASCNNASTGEQAAGASTEQEAAPSDSTSANQAQQMAYICPMECKGSASMEPGKCPVCGMDLEKNPQFQASADSTVTL